MSKTAWSMPFVAFAIGGCAATIQNSKIEDRARRAVPVAVCLKPLARHAGAGVVSALQPADYWSLVLPSFDPAANTVDRSSPDCTGRPVFDDPTLAEAEGPRSGSIPVKLEDAIVTPAPDGLRILWLRTHRFADGTAAGPLALVRPRAGYAEVYATGFFRGRAADSRFALERMGPRIVITASDDGCSGVKPNQRCQSDFAVFVMSAGQLVPSARFPLDRIDYQSVAGANGVAQIRLTASPLFQDRALRVAEQVVIRDAGQSVIRKSDLERVFQLSRDGHLVPTAESLWTQIAVSTPSPAEPPPVTAPSQKPPRGK